MKNRVLVLLIVFLTMLGALFILLIYQKKNQTPKTQTPQQMAYSPNLKGKIYLTLQEVGTDKQGVYYFDLETKKLDQLYVPEADCYCLGGELSKNRTQMLVSANCVGEEGKEGIGTLNLQTKEIEILTQSESNKKREAVWLPDGGFVYQGNSQAGETLDPTPTNWFIWKYDKTTGEETPITNSFHPFISPDGKKILSLGGGDGLTLVDIETGEGKLLNNFGDVYYIGNQLALSNQKDKAAVSFPGEHKIVIYKINSWGEDASAEEIDTISTGNNEVYWPKFSPDDTYLTAEEVNGTKNELVVYDLNTKKRTLIKDLSNYDKNAMWINDWK